jgi:hypothetical protein
LQIKVKLAVERWVRRNDKALKEALPANDAAAVQRLADRCISQGLKHGGEHFNNLKEIRLSEFVSESSGFSPNAKNSESSNKTS